MKRYGTLLAGVLAGLVLASAGSRAQTPASAIWNLTADGLASVTGDLQALGQSLVSMQAQYTGGVQRASPAGTAGTWPGEAAENSTRYMEFAVSPAAGNVFTVSSVSIYLYVNSGSGMRANVYYSKDPAFATRTQIGSTFSLTSTVPGTPNVAQPLTLDVADGETFYLRIHPWYTVSTTGKYVIAKAVTVEGSTSPTTSILTSIGVLNNFLQTSSAPSTTQTYTVSGRNLADSVLLTPSADFEISADGGSSWHTGVNPVILQQSGGGVLGQPVTIAVRLNASTAGARTGEITHASAGAPLKSVNLSGVKLADEPAVQSRLAFGSITGSSIAVTMTGGSGVRRILAVHAGSEVTWSPSDGNPVSGVNHNFSAASDQGGGNKVVCDGESTSVVVTALESNVSYYFAVYEYNTATGNSQNYLTADPGRGSATTPAVASLRAVPDTLFFGNAQAYRDTIVKTYTLSGVYLAADGSVSVTAPGGFELSLAETTGFSSSLQIAYGGTTLADTTLHVRFVPDEIRPYAGGITHTGGGADTLRVGVGGNGVKELVETDEPVGFASLSGGTTGGAGGAEAIVSTAQQLVDLLVARENKIFTPLTVYVVGTLSGLTDMVDIKRTANVSILGVGTDARLLGFGIKIVESHNIVIRNVTFADATAEEKDALNVDQSTNVWIDHCSFTDSPGVDPSGANHDGQLDVKNGSSNVTISYNYFTNHRKVALYGHSETQTSDTVMKVTYYRNFFDGTYSRQPRVRFGRAHVVNNLYTDVGVPDGYAIGSTCGAQVFVEANAFETTPLPVLISQVNDPGEILSGDPAGYVKATGNALVNSGAIVENLTGFDFEPRDFYAYTAADGASVKDIVMANAGAGKLDIVTDVAARSTRVPESFTLEQNFPNPFNPSTELRYELPEAGHVRLTIYDFLGRQVALLVDELQGAGYHHVVFRAEGLAGGVYFYKIRAGDFVAVKKLLLLR